MGAGACGAAAARGRSGTATAVRRRTGADDWVAPLPDTKLDAPADLRPIATAPPPRGAGLALAWIASAALIVALLAAGYVFRTSIMQAWPPSTRLYAALGLA